MKPFTYCKHLIILRHRLGKFDKVPMFKSRAAITARQLAGATVDRPEHCRAVECTSHNQALLNTLWAGLRRCGSGPVSPAVSPCRPCQGREGRRAAAAVMPPGGGAARLGGARAGSPPGSRRGPPAT